MSGLKLSRGEKLQLKPADVCFYCRTEANKMRQKTFVQTFSLTLNQGECWEECRVETKDRALFQDKQDMLTYVEDVSDVLHVVGFVLKHFHQQIYKSPNFVITVYRLESHGLVQSSTTTFQDVALNIFALSHVLLQLISLLILAFLSYRNVKPRQSQPFPLSYECFVSSVPLILRFVNAELSF